MLKHFSLFLVVMSTLIFEAKAEDAKYAPISDYKKETIQQFTILIHSEIANHPADEKRMLVELEKQLKAIHKVVPKPIIAKLKKVRIWVEWENKPKCAACFHPSPTWLKEKGYNPEKVRNIEISNVRNFVNWTRKAQPWMVLHELAHAHHFLNLGANNKDILAAYEHAMTRKQYENVEHVNGKKEHAYAMNNHKEYFAEISEAYFGKNDFYPFNSAELQKHDPLGYQLMVKSWGEPRKIE